MPPKGGGGEPKKKKKPVVDATFGMKVSRRLCCARARNAHTHTPTSSARLLRSRFALSVRARACPE
jgi:hypothetical protein